EIKQRSPSPDCPIIGETWYEAAAYCRWLSEQEGVPEDQQCYPPVGEILEGGRRGALKMAPDLLRRTGYRLPTEAEWEYVGRSGSGTDWSFGVRESRLSRYLWYLGDSNNRTHPTGQLKPNDLGLFDMHGNAWEWSQDPTVGYQPAPPGKARLDEGFPYPVSEKSDRILRGGAFYNQGVLCR